MILFAFKKKICEISHTKKKSDKQKTVNNLNVLRDIFFSICFVKNLLPAFSHVIFHQCNCYHTAIFLSAIGQLKEFVQFTYMYSVYNKRQMKYILIA